MAAEICNPAVPKSIRFIGVGSLSAARLIRSFKVIWKPGWPVVVRQMRKVPRLLLTSSRISANISSVVSWRMALPEHDVPAVDTIFSSPSLVKDAESILKTGTDCGFFPLSLRERAGVRVFKKAQIMTACSISVPAAIPGG